MKHITLLLTIVLGQAAFAQEPPAPALEHGLTRCGFGEEFDDYRGIDTSMDGDGSWRESIDELSSGDVGFAPMPGLRHHRYYVIIGSGQWRTQWDWVRVWQSPTIGAETNEAGNAVDTATPGNEYASHSELLPFARDMVSDNPEKLVFVNWHQLTHTDNNSGPQSDHIQATRTNRRIRHRVCRDVPLGRPVRRDDSGEELPYKEWFIADFAADLHYANALGADAVQPNAGSLDAGNPRGLRGYTLFLEACERTMAADPGFRTRIMVTQDFVGSPGATYADGQAIAAKLHTALCGVGQHSGLKPNGKSYTPYLQEDKADSPALFRIDGKLAFSHVSMKWHRVLAPTLAIACLHSDHRHSRIQIEGSAR